MMNTGGREHQHGYSAASIHRLLTIDRIRGRHKTGLQRLLPLAVAVLNLFFASYFERFIANDPETYYLSLFLFLQATVYVFLSLAHFIGSTHEVLRKTRVFPLKGFTRFTYAAVSSVIQPVAIGLVLTTSFALVILCRASTLSMIAAPILYLLLIANIESTLSALTRLLADRNRQVTDIAALLAVAALAVLIGSVVFRADLLITHLPLLSWVTAGIRSAGEGEYGSLAGTLTALSILPCAVLIAGLMKR
jgi:hypothetical protein